MGTNKTEGLVWQSYTFQNYSESVKTIPQRMYSTLQSEQRKNIFYSTISCGRNFSPVKMINDFVFQKKKKKKY